MTAQADAAATGDAGDGRIRITDLADPQLTDSQRYAIDMAATHPAEMSVDAVLAAAQRRTGLKDFGPDDYADRLAMWLREVDQDPTRTALGKLSIFQTCVRLASSRLQLLELLRRHPEIHREEITQPLIVVGLPRSGTTHLVNVLASDARFRSLPLWENYWPVDPRLVGDAAADDRRDRVVREWGRGKAVLPLMQTLHPMEPDHVHEECELQGLDFGGYMLEWQAHVPRWRDQYLAEDQTPRYAFMKDALKAVQWQRGPQQWVLKSPQHLEQLGPLMNTFPDATVVMTHRDPLSVIQSAATMVAYSARLNQTVVDPPAIFAYWLDRIEHMLRAAVRDRHLLPENRVEHVEFSSFMGDQAGTVERIYQRHGMDFAPQREAVAGYLQDHRRGKDGQVSYDLARDFGVSTDEVRHRFDFYAEAFPYRIEVR